MWVPKLLLPPEKLGFLAQNGQIWPKICFLGHIQALPVHLVPFWFVGWWLCCVARAVSRTRKTPIYFMSNDQKQDSVHYNAYETDIALVNIFFGDPTAYGNYANFYHYFIYNINIKEFERLPKMTWLDFISGFGGLCGLCLGISFVSVAEILYWFSIRLCRRF